MTREEAIAKYETGWWKDSTDKEIVDFQLFESRLCMPFDRFHEAVGKVLGRPVFTHEFADSGKLRDDYERAMNGEPLQGPDFSMGYFHLLRQKPVYRLP